MTTADPPVREGSDDSATRPSDDEWVLASTVPPEREPVRGAHTRHRLVTARADGRWVFDDEGRRFAIGLDDACRLADRLAIEVVDAVAPGVGTVSGLRIDDSGITLTLLSPEGTREVRLSDDVMDTLAPVFLDPVPHDDGWLPTDFNVRFDECAAAWLHFYLPELEGQGAKRFRFFHAGSEVSAGEVVRGDETMIEVPASVLGSRHGLTVTVEPSEPTAPDDGRSLGIILSAISRTTGSATA